MRDKLSPGWRKLVVTVSGGSVLIVGIIAIPYPGPGWLIVFAGLAILSTEYEWAGRALKYGRKKYDDWNNWIKKQNIVLKSLTYLVTAAVVVVTLWLVNSFGLMNTWLHLGQDWLTSPFLRH